MRPDAVRAEAADLAAAFVSVTDADHALSGGNVVLGGILTRPETGRAKLNLDTMATSLSFLDLADGAQRDAFRLEPELHRDSIRHLAVDNAGRVAFAMQYEGPKADRVPLVGLHDGRGIKTFAPPREVERRMRHYAGSIAFDAGGTVLGVTHPRGEVVTFWDAASGALLWNAEMIDGCGIASVERPGAFVVTSGTGEVGVMNVKPRTRVRLHSAASAHAWGPSGSASNVGSCQSALGSNA